MLPTLTARADVRLDLGCVKAALRASSRIRRRRPGGDSMSFAVSGCREPLQLGCTRLCPHSAMSGFRRSATREVDARRLGQRGRDAP